MMRPQQNYSNAVIKLRLAIERHEAKYHEILDVFTKCSNLSYSMLIDWNTEYCDPELEKAIKILDSKETFYE